MTSSNSRAILPTYNPLALLNLTGILTYHKFRLSDTPDLSGKIALVTGGSAGIGREITGQLLLHGIQKVYVLARSDARYIESKKEWVEKMGLKQDVVDSRTEFVPCNLASIKEVSQAAIGLLNKLERLDILVNNAALPLVLDYVLSPDGVENYFAVNHLGHYVLSTMLLPLMEMTASTWGDVRIVNTTSSVYMACQELDLSKLTSLTPMKTTALIDSFWRYGRSKLATILFTKELVRRLQKKGVNNIYANVYFPGNIPTEAMDVWKQLIGTIPGTLFKGIWQLIGQSPRQGAATAIYLAASKEVKTRNLKGNYFVPIASEHTISGLAEEKDLAKNVWYWSDHKVTEVLGERWQEVGEQS